MFSPSLVSMIWHSLSPGATAEMLNTRLDDGKATADALDKARRRFSLRGKPMPQVPVIGRTRDFQAALLLADFAVLTESPAGAMFVHGRIDVDKLIDHFTLRHGVDPADEMFDLGTPLRHLQTHGAAASAATCSRLLSATGVQPAVDIAVVDRGDPISASPPLAVSARLHCATPTLQPSPHCVDVLSVLLERLDHHGLLGSASMLCALVGRPKAPIGLGCFDHANSVEMLDALRDLHWLLMGRGTSAPACINLSMGTHVGPHDGHSPLEEFVRSHFSPANQRYFHAAAGNDGGKGVAAVTQLAGGYDDHLHLMLGSSGCTEVLVELWWDTALGSLEVEVEISQAGVRKTILPLFIDSRSAGTTLGTNGFANGVLSSALFHGACHGQRSCIAFSLSAATPAALAGLDVDLRLGSATPLMVNTWLVICEDDRSAFIASGTAATINVPATESSVVSVAGATAAGQAWAASSRGPAAAYSLGANWLSPPTAPYLSHQVGVTSSTAQGTSFASPRACADTAARIVAGHPPVDAQDAAREVVKHYGKATAAWNPRVGFGVVV